MCYGQTGTARRTHLAAATACGGRRRRRNGGVADDAALDSASNWTARRRPGARKRKGTSSSKRSAAAWRGGARAAPRARVGGAAADGGADRVRAGLHGAAAGPPRAVLHLTLRETPTWASTSPRLLEADHARGGGVHARGGGGRAARDGVHQAERGLVALARGAAGVHTQRCGRGRLRGLRRGAHERARPPGECTAGERPRARQRALRPGRRGRRAPLSGRGVGDRAQPALPRRPRGLRAHETLGRRRPDV